MKTEGLRVLTTIPTAPTTLYLAWLSSEQHSAMTGGAAKVDPNVGGKFTAWNGYITGKLVVLDLGRRIVMSWRTTDFPRDAIDSRVEVQFEALGGGTRLLILHTDIPEGQGSKYRAGWNDKYFTPMRTYFSKYLPDPRKPPPPRRPPPPEEEEELVALKKGKAAIKILTPPKKPGAKPPAPAPPPSKKGAPSTKSLPAKAAPPPPKSKTPAAKAPPPPPSKAAPSAKAPAPAAKPKKPASAAGGASVKKKPPAKVAAKPKAKSKAKKK